MAGRHFLQIPGPTPVPDRLQRAMHRQMEDHRSSAFPALTRSILSRLPQVVHQTQGEAFVFPASGTAMWEAALVNTQAPGARLLAVRFGQFSHLFIQTARALGYTVDVIEEPWGEAADPAKIEAALRADTAHEIQGVLLVHNETATGVTSDVPRRALPNLFAHSVIPIIVGYIVAHYLTYFLEVGSRTVAQSADPLGKGWNLFYLSDFPLVVWLSYHPTLLAAHLLALPKPYWVPVSCLAVIQGVSLRAIAVLAAAGVALALGNIAFYNAADEGDIGVVSVLDRLAGGAAAIEEASGAPYVALTTIDDVYPDRPDAD